MAILDGLFWMAILGGFRPGPDHTENHRTDGLMPLQIAKIGVGGGKEPKTREGWCLLNTMKPGASLS